MDGQCSQKTLSEKLLLYLDNALGTAERLEVESHLSACAPCARDLELLEAAAGRLRAHPYLLRTATGFGACIPAADLVAYSDGTHLAAELRRAIEQHADCCASCRGELALLAELAAEPLPSGSLRPAVSAEAFIKMVSNRMPLKKTIRRSAVQRALRLLECCMETARQWLAPFFAAAPQPVAVRRKPRLFEENVTVITDTSHGIAARIEIEALDESAAEIILLVSDAETAAPVDHIRATLMEGDAELMSIFVEQGTAVFQNIPHGSYRMVLANKGLPLKTVAFDTRRPPAV